MYYTVSYRKAYQVNATVQSGVIEAYNCADARHKASGVIPKGYTIEHISKRGGQNPLHQACVIMKKIECVADSVGYDIDNDQRWIIANGLIVAFEFGERLFDNAFKQELGKLVMAVNQSVYPEYDVIIEYAKGL